jgi:hypothetical protein
MKPDGRQDRIKAFFCDLKREDERHAPPFWQVLQAAEARSRSAFRPTLWGVAAASAAVLLVAAGAFLLAPRSGGQPAATSAPTVAQSHAPQTPQPMPLEISRWESPTAFLLKPPAGPLLGPGSV